MTTLDLKNQITYYVSSKGGNIQFAPNKFDKAILGVDSCKQRVIYSVAKCYEILMKDEEMSNEQAEEHFAFSVLGNFKSANSPIWCYDLWEQK